ncbi:hypothetical protein CFIO01_06368 [Colletotrichum fioriniae PJ7]|uniref:Uncharacterized protein n=1 Tax=Colletotrichum fioriniae PJ7 TaxID=1445577 RepID=A0A010QKU0_9PEZI|nr:hypothetical protein CFIO01_06368 [Colletotrichum fioriniae PJ7]
MSSGSSPVKKAAIQDSADSSGPSKFSEREFRVLATRAVNRLPEAVSALLHSVNAFFGLLSRLKIRANEEELRDAIMEVYDLADNLLDLTLQTEEYISITAYESLLGQTNTVRAAMSALLPQDLHDTLVGKGKGVTKSE